MQNDCSMSWQRADPDRVNGSRPPLGMVLTPLAQLDHFSAGFRYFDHRFGFIEGDRVGRQLDLCTVCAELSDGAVVAGFARHGEFEVIHTGQASATTGILDESDFFQGHVAVEQFDPEFAAMLLDPLQRALAQAVVVP